MLTGTSANTSRIFTHGSPEIYWPRGFVEGQLAKLVQGKKQSTFQRI